METGKRGSRQPSTRRRGAFRPTSERLEGRALMAVLDLTNLSAASLGVQEVGAVANDGAGYSVANVGDVTGSGYDSFLITSPTVTGVGNNGPTAGTGQSKAYLVFGSSTVNSTTITNFLNLTPNQRIGDLATLGQTNQVNPAIVPPTDGSPVGFNFDGIVFTTDTSPNSLLGASVAGVGDINGDGVNDFVIGAPNDGTGGAAFVVFGGSNLRTTNVTNVNLDGGTGPTKIVTIRSNTSGDQFGFGVGGVGKFLSQGTNFNDILIGAPGTNGSAGAAYLLSGSALTAAGSGTTITADTIGAANGNGILFQGQSGDRAGAAVSSAGNFDGTTNNNLPVSSIIIGAPGSVTGTTFSSGRAYVIYGNQSIGTTAGPAFAAGSTYSLGLVGATPTTAIPNPIIGLNLQGISAARLGFSVAAAGDFNGDGFGDIILGAPGSSTGVSGFAAVVYGTTSAARPNGSFNIDPIASSSLVTQYFTGETATDLAGYSVSALQNYSATTSGVVRAIVIGSPGFSGNLGAVYTIPSTQSGTGVTSLALIPTSLNGARIVATNSLPGNPPAFGASVSGRPFYATNLGYTVDQDGLDDLIIGAPGFSLINPTTGNSTTRALAGAGYAVSGLKILDRINPAIGVNGTSPPYSVDPTSTANITITVFSTAATPTQPAFAPFTEINQSSIIINGVAFPTVTNFTSVPDINGDGIPEASFQVSPALLNLTGSTANILVTGVTTSGRTFVGDALVFLSGNVVPPNNGGGTVTGVIGTNAFAQLNPRSFSGLYNGELVPPVQTLEHLNSYKPLPVTVAYEQFLAAPGFRAREQLFAKKGKVNTKLHQAPAGTTVNDKYYGVSTLPHKVFVRGKFKKGETITFKHKVKVIPRDRQHEKFTSF